MKRESFKSRLGFLLVSAGCAIGIGNVWRFPYVVGQNGGGLFVLLYLIFLIAMGLPVLTRLVRNCRLLYADDVLYNSFWLDGYLFL